MGRWDGKVIPNNTTSICGGYQQGISPNPSLIYLSFPGAIYKAFIINVPLPHPAHPLDILTHRAAQSICMGEAGF